MSQSSNHRTFFTTDSRFAVKPPAAGKIGPGTLEGYALVWNVLSTDRGGYVVRLKPGSAKFATPTLALFHHDFRLLIGNTENSTLRYSTDEIGVKVEIDLPDTDYAVNTYNLVRDKYCRGMSFAMTDAPEGTTVTEGGITIMDASSYTVDEITVTPIPAFTQSMVGVKGSQGFSARSAQSLQLQKFRFDACRMGAFVPARK